MLESDQCHHPGCTKGRPLERCHASCCVGEGDYCDEHYRPHAEQQVRDILGMSEDEVVTKAHWENAFGLAPPDLLSPSERAEQRAKLEKEEEPGYYADDGESRSAAIRLKLQ